MRTTAILAGVFAVGLLSPIDAASADSTEVITFSNLTSGSCYPQGPTVSSGSFTFTANDGFWMCDPGIVANNPSPALLDANAQSIITMSDTTGDEFSLESFFAGTRNQPYWYALATGVQVTGTLAAGGTVTQTFAFDGTSWGEFFLDSSFVGLSSVTFTAVSSGQNSEFLIDDIHVTEALPEPTTWALMLLGFGAICGALRRTRRTNELPQLA